MANTPIGTWDLGEATIEEITAYPPLCVVLHVRIQRGDTLRLRIPADHLRPLADRFVRAADIHEALAAEATRSRH